VKNIFECFYTHNAKFISLAAPIKLELFAEAVNREYSSVGMRWPHLTQMVMRLFAQANPILNRYLEPAVVLVLAHRPTGDRPMIKGSDLDWRIRLSKDLIGGKNTQPYGGDSPPTERVLA